MAHANGEHAGSEGVNLSQVTTVAGSATQVLAAPGAVTSHIRFRCRDCRLGDNRYPKYRTRWFLEHRYLPDTGHLLHVYLSKNRIGCIHTRIMGRRNPWGFPSSQLTSPSGMHVPQCRYRLWCIGLHHTDLLRRCRRILSLVTGVGRATVSVIATGRPGSKADACRGIADGMTSIAGYRPLYWSIPKESHRYRTGIAILAIRGA